MYKNLGIILVTAHYIDGTPVSKTLKTTGKLVAFLDDIFDSVNGAALYDKKSKGKYLRKAVTSDSKHHAFWNDAIKKLSDIKYIDRQGRKITVPSITNFILTLKSYKRLWQFFCSKGIKIMRPRYLNSDSIENFFGQVRAYNFRSNNPDCHSFINTYKSLLITGFIKFHNPTFNCEDDNFTQLLKVNKLFQSNLAESSISCPYNIVELNTDNITNSVEEARRERLIVHSRAYTAGWVVRKILNKIKCNECTTKLTTCQTSDIHKWISHKEFSQFQKNKLTYPSEYAIRYFGVILQESNEFLEKMAHSLDISKQIKTNVISKLNFDDISCESHHNTLLNLFCDTTIKLSVFNYCNIINKILKGTDIHGLQKGTLPMMQSKALIKYKKKLKKK